MVRPKGASGTGDVRLGFVRRVRLEFHGSKPRRVVAKVEWHPGELFPRVGFVVTNLPMEPVWIIQYYNQLGTAEQRIKEGKQAINWTRPSRKGMAQNEVRLQLHALAYNLGVFLQGAGLPEEMADWSLTSLQTRLIKIVARAVRHARAITFQLAESRSQWRSTPSHLGGHPSAARATGSRMRMPAAKPEGKRLDRAVRTCADQIEIRFNPAANAGVLARLVRQMPVSQHNVSKTLDRGPKKQQHAGQGVLLGECRIQVST